jgi:hypothetical protein
MAKTKDLKGNKRINVKSLLEGENFR